MRTRRSRHPDSRTIASVIAAILWLSPGSAGFRDAPFAAARDESVLYRSRDLLIYRAVDRRGAPVVVLTNLDEEGNALAAPDESTRSDASSARPQAETCPPTPPPAQSAAESPGRRDAGSGGVRVVVNTGDGSSDNQGGVEVATGEAGGTTVIVNVNPPPRPEPDSAAVPGGSFYPVLAYGGIVGPYRYPDHLYFLGYGPDTSSPSYFSGLGLNAGNRFGLQTGVSCSRGFDCMFGPPHGQH